MNKPETITYSKHQIICIQGQDEHDLFSIRSGKVLVFINEGKKIVPLSVIGSGEYFGEFSFFDKSERSANIVTLEESQIVQIPAQEISKNLPPWFILMAKTMAKKIRKINVALKKSGHKKSNFEIFDMDSSLEQLLNERVLEFKRQLR